MTKIAEENMIIELEDWQKERIMKLLQSGELLGYRYSNKPTRVINDALELLYTEMQYEMFYGIPEEGVTLQPLKADKETIECIKNEITKRQTILALLIEEEKS